MIRTILCVLAVTALGAPLCPAQAKDDATAKELKAQYIKYMNAVKAKDTTTMESMMAPDFKMKMGNQTWNRKQSMDMMKQHLGMVKSYDKWNYTFGGMTHKGNMATGIVHEDTATTVMGEDKKPHKMTEKGTSKTTFRKMGGEWKVVSVTSTNDKMTMDGKPFDMNKAMSQQGNMGRKMGHTMGGKMKHGSM